jgi:hypothetical protein
MKAACSSEKLEPINQAAKHDLPEDLNLTLAVVSILYLSTEHSPDTSNWNGHLWSNIFEDEPPDCRTEHFNVGGALTFPFLRLSYKYFAYCFGC